VAAPITHFVSFEVGNLIDALSRLRSIANPWRWAFIAVIGMITVIHVASKVVRAMKPRAGANERTTGKPFRAVVAVGSAAIRSSVIVAIRACGSGSNFEADVDLSLRLGSGHRKADSGSSNSNECYISKPVH
jgi:hypothetical protein